MKKFTITGFVLAIMAVGVLLACTKVYTKTKGKSKYMKITISTATGEVVKKVDENNDEATELTPQEIQQLYQNQGPQHVGTLLYTHSSPGCVYYCSRGKCYKICE